MTTPFDVNDLCDTLIEISDKHGLGLSGFLYPGKTYGGSTTRPRIYCPSCHGGQHKETNFNIKVDDDGKGLTWICGRANKCGITGGERLKGFPFAQGIKPVREKRTYTRPAPALPPPPDDGLVTWYANFNITEATLRELGIHLSVRDMPPEGPDGRPNRAVPPRPRKCVTYPYVRHGELLNLKYKAKYREGKDFRQFRNAEPSLFNIDSVIGERMVIVEGEDDVAAVYEAGYTEVVTISNGSPTRQGKDDEDGKVRRAKPYDPDQDLDDRYEAIREEPKLAKLTRIVLAGDGDEAGWRHMEELAWRLGRGRCFVARWPYGCKDAKATLAKYGRDTVNQAIERAEPFPIEGLLTRGDRDELVAYHRGEDETPLLTGVEAVDEFLRCVSDGMFCVTTGTPGSGKSAYWLCHAVWLAEMNERLREQDVRLPPFHCVICSPEMRIKEIWATLCAIRAQRPFRLNGRYQPVPPMPVQEMLDTYLPWVEKHFTILEPPNQYAPPTIDWLLERGELAIQRTGAKMFLADPWTNFEVSFNRGENETLKIARTVQTMVRFSKIHRVNFILVAHPKSMLPTKDGKQRVPGGYDISGGATFYNSCDVGMTLHRPDTTMDVTEITLWKVKQQRFGRHGATFKLKFKSDCHRFYPLMSFEEATSNVVPLRANDG